MFLPPVLDREWIFQVLNLRIFPGYICWNTTLEGIEKTLGEKTYSILLN